MRYGIMRCGMKNQMIYATALLVLAIPGLLGGVRPAKAEAPPTPATIGQTWTRPKDGAEMVAVPAGEFTMGSNDPEIFMTPSRPQRQVTLDGYWIDKNLVTVAQYRKFCKATGRKMPDPPEWGWKDDHPVVNVTWYDAKVYCDWAGASLPTEAQWEKAARGTDGRAFPWGNQWDATKANSLESRLQATTPVGSYPEGASPYGALDMAGNVWEWCADYYGKDYYKSAPARNPTGPRSGEGRVQRGGSWGDSLELPFRCAYRHYDVPGYRYLIVGFRCALRADG